MQQKRMMPVFLCVVLLAIAGIGGCRGRGSPAAPAQGDAPGDAAAPLAVGQSVYEAECAECHGVAGEGQPNWRQASADGVLPAPPHDSTGHTWHHPDAQLLDIIARGGSMPNSQMPAYADGLSQAEMKAVLAYIKTFWGEREREYQEQVTKQFEAQ